MANLIGVRLNKGDGGSWGFRLQGGKDFGTPLVVQKVMGGSPADRAGLIAGDTVVKINNVDVYNLRHKDAQDVIMRAGPSFDIFIQRGGSTWKPAVTPVGSVSAPRPASSVNNISPVTHTSLAAQPQENIGAIGTSHNLSAKPFSVAVNGGGPRLVNKQYNSPLPLYSEQSIAETLSAQAEVLSNGVLGVNFKKNEKSYDSANSAVFRMVQEADKEPRDYEAEAEPSSGVVTAPLGVAGLRHVHAPETKPQPTTPQLPPGQNICAECERLIVGVFVRIKEKNLHVECFKCATCGTSLKHVGYYNINNKLYCDVHAKLAAVNNRPGTNLQPVTVPPGGRIPSGTISAALSSHSLPSPAPLSPSTPNYAAAPYQSGGISAAPYQPGGTNYSSPRPFSSVSAPLSPSSTIPKASPISTPSAPLTECRSFVQNIVWPPASEEPELPTASPLYFPPPSQVKIPQKLPPKDPEPEYEEIHDCDYGKMSYVSENYDRNMSLCSMEISNITEHKSASECTETISDTIDRQILVESILQSRPKSPPPIGEPAIQVPAIQFPPADVAVSFTISEAELKKGAYERGVCETTKTSLKETQSASLASMYEKKIKVENSIPQKWESPMVVALTTASPIPYSQTEMKNQITDADPFSQIPTAKSTSILASALVTAPAKPFTPVSSNPLELVPLPAETEPYFPPEHLIVIEPKQPKPPKEEIERPDSTFVQALRTAPEKEFTPVTPPPKPPKKKQPKREDDEFLKDLPKPPAERISMRAALTIAPDRPFSPFSANSESYETTETLERTEIEMVTEKQEISKSAEETQKTQQVMNRKAIEKPVLPKNLPIKEFTAPERLYSPFTINKTAYEGSAEATSLIKSEQQSKEESRKIVEQQSSSETSKNVETIADTTTRIISTESPGFAPIIQMVKSSFETKTDKVQMEMSCEFPGAPVIKKRVIEKLSKDVVQEKSEDRTSNTKTSIEEQRLRKGEMSSDEMSSQQTLKVTQHSKNAVMPPVVQAIQQQEITETALLQKAVYNAETVIKSSTSEERSKEKLECIKSAAPKERVTIVEAGKTNLNIPQISFQPVADQQTSNTTFSPRPRPLTPSMINKPAPVIPAYQAKLVHMHQPAAEANLFDPTSPATSRSPSPYVGGRSPSPFPSSSARPVSPAAGPPPNPLQSHKSPAELMYEGRKETARSHVSSFIPQHQNYYQSNVVLKSQGASGLCQSMCNVEKAEFAGYQTDVKKQEHAGATSIVATSMQQQGLLEKANMQQQTVQTSQSGLTQTQRKKTVVEEYEHSHKETMVQSQKCSSSETSRAVMDNQGVVGFHITNPQPLKSPFITANENACCQSSVQRKSSLKTPQCDPKSTPKPTNAIPAPPASSSNVNVTIPNVSRPNAGTGGGRQAGAIGVAPKRGRGILNLASTPGSRVPLCAQCHSNIRGPFITALGKIWCPDHFICATPQCRRALHDLGFVEERGQLYCEYCFEQYLAPPCAKCSAKVKGDCLKAIGKNFHPECFNCVYCGKLFGNSPFFLEDGQPYCDNDWNELFTTKCFACGFPVEAGDRWVEALNNNYHSQCFNCTMCKKNLEGQSFFAKGGRPFCKNHAR